MCVDVQSIDDEEVVMKINPTRSRFFQRVVTRVITQDTHYTSHYTRHACSPVAAAFAPGALGQSPGQIPFTIFT